MLAGLIVLSEPSFHAVLSLSSLQNLSSLWLCGPRMAPKKNVKTKSKVLPKTHWATPPFPAEHVWDLARGCIAAVTKYSSSIDFYRKTGVGQPQIKRYKKFFSDLKAALENLNKNEVIDQRLAAAAGASANLMSVYKRISDHKLFASDGVEEIVSQMQKSLSLCLEPDNPALTPKFLRSLAKSWMEIQGKEKHDSDTNESIVGPRAKAEDALAKLLKVDYNSVRNARKFGIGPIFLTKSAKYPNPPIVEGINDLHYGVIVEVLQNIFRVPRHKVQKILSALGANSTFFLGPDPIENKAKVAPSMDNTTTPP
jgi:hypothetical protein